MRVLVTGAKGFIAKNLIVRLRESGGFEVSEYSRESGLPALQAIVRDVDVVVHLAGVNRPADPAEFNRGNAGLTEALCIALRKTGRPIPVIFSSSAQADRDNPYGSSKRAAEEILHAYGRENGAPVYIYRLPNVFGKWCKPDYNSAVATFCHNIARGLPIVVNDPSVRLSLVYVDDVVAEFMRILREAPINEPGALSQVPVVYQSTVGELAAQITAFHDSRKSLVTERVGTGLTRALYATYISYCAPDHVMYAIPRHAVEQRMVFSACRILFGPGRLRNTSDRRDHCQAMQRFHMLHFFERQADYGQFSFPPAGLLRHASPLRNLAGASDCIRRIFVRGTIRDPATRARSTRIF